MHIKVKSYTRYYLIRINNRSTLDAMSSAVAYKCTTFLDIISDLIYDNRQ